MDGKKFVERLEKALNVKGNSELARILGGSDTIYSNWRSGYSKPKIDFLLNEIGVRNINIHWLLTGEGEMYLKPRENLEEEAGDYHHENLAEEIGKLVIRIYQLLTGRA